MPRWTGNVLLLLGSAAISLTCVEAAVALVLAYPGLLPRSSGALGKPVSLLSNYYKNYVRESVQFLPECARYDPEVTYTLRPGGRCRVARSGRVAQYSANRAGLRDSDSALDNPAVVVLGDSHAMGAGVEAAESFPEQVERILGLPVLNAGISSFGTARELILLERLKLPSSAALVIQYCENDFRENRVYVDNGALPILSEREYRAIVDSHVRTTRYYPFEHVRNIVRRTGELIFQQRSGEAAVQTDSAEARYFLETLRRHHHLLQGRRVVVLELNGDSYDDGRFIEALRQRLAEPQYADLARWVTTIDVSVVLGQPADYLPLDGHMRPQGHMKVARLVAQELRRRGLQSASPSHRSVSSPGSRPRGSANAGPSVRPHGELELHPDPEGAHQLAISIDNRDHHRSRWR